VFGKTKKGKVFVGISGGVDSGVSAALLQQAGYDVTGVFIKIKLEGYPCPAAKDRIEAMRVAAHLNIPFREIDLSKEYEQAVFALSLKEFEAGRTPNPDALCNREIKFGVFFDFARAQGADYVATGHYAQTRDGELFVSTDENKDQSYFLWAVPGEKLRHTLFPIGHLEKKEVRNLAKKFGLPNAARPDSQGLCFLGDIGIEQLLEREITHEAGNVLSEEGERIGTHRGVRFYTLGERHGFTLFPVSHGQSDIKPHYVIAKDVAANTITVSDSPLPRAAKSTVITIAETNWIGDVEDGTCEARYRYRGSRIPARVTKTASGAQVVLEKPFFVPLGQSLVLYRGSRCVGGGIISDAKIQS
jgi:tRNA-specific 2-thiouridylase